MHEDVSVDIEGVAGVVHPGRRVPAMPNTNARRQMTAEANAAIAGAFDGGASAVIVNDSHGDFRNLLAATSIAAREMLLGKPRDLGMMAGVDRIAARVPRRLAREGASGGVLAHTINSFAFARVSANGAETGEAGIYGAVAAEYGVPVALLTGDDVFVAETAPPYPGASTSPSSARTATASRRASRRRPLRGEREGARDAAVRARR